MKQIGRPDDKSKYITNVITSLNANSDTDEQLKSALGKLNARELIALNTYIAKRNKMSLEDTIALLPNKTPAQKSRIVDAVELYNKLESRNGNHATPQKTQTSQISQANDEKQDSSWKNQL